MVRARALALGVVPCLLAALSGAPARAATGTGPVVDRVVRDQRITEASGLAVSLRTPGLLWTHEDSGNSPTLYALRRDGRTAAAVRLSGVDGVDWEAMAAFRDAAGRAWLAVADTGDNRARRSSVQIVLLPEPAPARTSTVAPARTLRLRYPDGPVDAETLLVDAEAARMYVVTKGFSSTVYQVPVEVWPGSAGGGRDSGTLQRIATVPLILVTDGVMGPGHHPLLRTYGELAVLPPITADVVGGTLEPLAVAPLPAQPQGEALALTPAGEVLLASEGVSQPILRLPMPGTLAAVLSSASPGSPSGTSAPEGPPGRAPHAGTGRGDGGDGVPWWPFLAGAVVVAGILGAAFGRRRTRP